MVLINEKEDIFALIRLNDTFAIRLWLDNVTNDIHQSDEHGFTLLHWAAWYGRLSLVQSLLQRSVRVNAVNRADDTPLHLAAGHNHLDIVEYLIKHKAYINVTNIHGNTPLHYACFHRYFPIAKCLIEAQALLFISNRYGQTPIDLCSSQEMRIQLNDLAKSQGQDERILPFEDHHHDSNIMICLPIQSVIDIRELQFEKCLHSNNRKEVWQAIYHDTSIMAKIYKLKYSSYTPDMFQHEIDKIKIFNSSYLLVPFAICHDTPNLIVLTQYLHGHQTLYQSLHNNPPIDRTIALKLAIDIGRGMAYLHGISNSFRPQFILNSHHIMVQTYCIHSVNEQTNDEYIARLNLADCHFSFESNFEIEHPAWMAPEVLENGILTNASDIWSFAILLWELFTCQVPFHDLTPMECGFKILQEHLRLPTTGISSHIDKLIQLCTHNDSTKRPTFDAILPILEKIHF